VFCIKINVYNINFYHFTLIVPSSCLSLDHNHLPASNGAVQNLIRDPLNESPNDVHARPPSRVLEGSQFSAWLTQ